MISNSTVFRMPRQVVFGAGAAETVGTEARALGARHAFVVSDANLQKLGIVDQVVSRLAAEGIASTQYAVVDIEPNADGADSAAEAGRASGCDLVVGVGGGSSMDTAKAVAVVAGHGGRLRDYLGTGLVPGRAMPTILIPTTAGTGAECTPNSLFFVPELRDKKAIVSPHTIPDVAIVDPVLTVTLPAAGTAATGVDALCHAVEAYTSSIAAPMSDMYALEAIRLIGAYLRTAVGNGANLEAREAMARASMYAGIAIANAGTNAVHALAYPLQGQHRITHGIANSLMLPYVLDFNAVSNLARFAKAAGALGEPVGGLSPRDAALRCASACRQLSEDVGIPQNLKSLGVGPQHVEELTEAAMQVTRLLANNPRKITRDDVKAIYERAL